MNDIETLMLKYLKQCKKTEGNPVNRSVAQLAQELDTSTSTARHAVRILTAYGHIIRDVSDHTKPKIFVN